jgi:hypothetical protein
MTQHLQALEQNLALDTAPPERGLAQLLGLG